MKFFVIAGEPSGDRLGAALIAGLKLLAPGVSFAGVGGPLMQAEGLQSQFPMQELSIMGLAEVLPRYMHLKRRIREVAAAVRLAEPAALITIDSPDFCLRVAALAKADLPQLRTIHYVAPSVWAWRPGRARRMARVIDHVMALLPFEPPYMTAAGMSCDFVGHPVVAEPVATRDDAAQFRAARGIAPDAPVVIALPGSRRGEVARLAMPFGDSLRQIVARHPETRVIVPTLQAIAPMVATLTQGWPGKPVYVTSPDPQERAACFACADVALAASGTVSLELAAQACPMVIAYDMNSLTLWLMRRAALIDTVTLVNLVADTRVVPEFIGDRCKGDLIATALLGLMHDPALRAEQVAAMQITMQRLGAGGEAPGLRAARSVLARL